MDEAPKPVPIPISRDAVQLTNRRRVAINETVYHQQIGKQPTSISHRSSRWLLSDEQPWRREFTVGPEWIPLDLGWIGDRVGLLHLANLGGSRLPTNPTIENLTETLRLTVDVAILIDINDRDEPRDQHSPPLVPVVLVPTWQVPPGDALRGLPRNPQNLRVCCVGGLVKCVLNLFPA